MWVVDTAMIQSGEVSGEVSNGAVMERESGGGSKEGTCHLQIAAFYPHFVSSISGFYFGKITCGLWRIVW